MLLSFTIAVFLMVVTTGIHAEATILSRFLVNRSLERQRMGLLRRTQLYWVGGIVFFLFLVAVVEVLVWATTYLALGAIRGLEQACYFSMVTFTTLGYGEIVLDDRWRLLASFEAVNGIIMFGWTTAIVVAAVQRIYLSEGLAPVTRNPQQRSDETF